MSTEFIYMATSVIWNLVGNQPRYKFKGYLSPILDLILTVLLVWRILDTVLIQQRGAFREEYIIQKHLGPLSYGL